MGALIIGAIILIFCVSRYDKWDTREEPKGNISLNEIQDMFENHNDKERDK